MENNYREKVLEHYDIEITSDDYQNVDLSVYNNYTADQYDIWLINSEGGMDHDIDWEHDVFMYPESISEYVSEYLRDPNRRGEKWMIYDEEDILPDWWWEEEYDHLIKTIEDKKQKEDE